MKVHIDFGYFCWQLVSVVQHNLEHDDDEPEALGEVNDISASDLGGPSMGFLRVTEDEE